MVLPPPTSPDAPAEASHGIFDRLRLILRLAEAGVLVLVDEARLEQLGTFVRMLATVEPNIEVLANALDLLAVPDGSAVVLVPNLRDATWLNQERPIFSQKKLRVLLYCDSEISKTLAQKAPDFFHWISHRMEAPKGAWPPAVFGLRAAAMQGANVAWQGGDFDSAVAAAFPEQSYAIHSAATSYDELVDLMQRERGVLVLKDVDGLFRLRRVRWALAESARKEMVVLDQPATTSGELWGLHARPAKLEEVIRELKAAGAQHPGRLAATLHLEPEAINVAARLLQHGISEETVASVILENEDAGVAIVHKAIEKKIDLDIGIPPARRALKFRAPPEDAIKLDDQHILEAAGGAFDEGDPEVALRWAKRARTRGVDRIDTLMTLASLAMTQGQFRVAENALNEAILLDEQRGNHRRRRADVLALMASLQQRTGKLHAARRTIEKALRVRKRSAGTESAAEHAHALVVLGRILEDQGDLRGAEQAFRRAVQINANESELVAEALLDLARVLYERHALDDAKQAIENSMSIFESLHGREHHRVATCFHELGRVFLAKEDLRQARQALEEAVRIRRQVGDDLPTPDNANTLHILGRILAALGDFNSAIDYLNRAIAMNRRLFNSDIHPHIADSLHEIGLIHIGMGNLANARGSLERSLEIELQIYGNDEHYQIAVTKSNLGMVMAMMGERDAGLEMIRKAHRVLLEKLGPEHPATRDAAMKLERFS